MFNFRVFNFSIFWVSRNAEPVRRLRERLQRGPPRREQVGHICQGYILAILTLPLRLGGGGFLEKYILPISKLNMMTNLLLSNLPFINPR